jgi:hypothetical protein
MNGSLGDDVGVKAVAKINRVDVVAMARVSFSFWIVVSMLLAAGGIFVLNGKTRPFGSALGVLTIPNHCT